MERSIGRDAEAWPRSRITFIFLTMGSLLLLFGSIYVMNELAIFYGIGAGAAVQSLHDNATLAPSVAIAADQLQTVHQDILEAYVLVLVALGLLAGAFMMLVRRERPAEQSRYVPYHAAMAVVYTLLLYLIVSGPYTTIQNIYMYLTYSGIAVCLGCDVFLEYTNRTRLRSRAPGLRRTMAMDPSRPLSNMLSLREELFSRLTGQVGIIDRHFNSTALENLHRLVSGAPHGFTRITILTSSAMLGSDILGAVSDFRSEMAQDGVAIEVRLMDSKDAEEQHERILLDDRIAYKIPPFNIINKKSEHITTISHDQAARRFGHLYGRATKLENYLEKQARTGAAQP